MSWRWLASPRGRYRVVRRLAGEHGPAMLLNDDVASMTDAVFEDASGFNRTRLESGLRVVTEQLPALRSVAVGFWVGTGSRDETDELAGASHFLEHLLFKGTDTRRARRSPRRSSRSAAT